MRKSSAVMVILDLLIFAVSAWVMELQRDSAARAKAYWHLSRACQSCASWFGQRAIELELSYMDEVQA